MVVLQIVNILAKKISQRGWKIFKVQLNILIMWFNARVKFILKILESGL